MMGSNSAVLLKRPAYFPLVVTLGILLLVTLYIMYVSNSKKSQIGPMTLNFTQGQKIQYSNAGEVVESIVESDKKAVFLFIAIGTKNEYITRRQEIRRTWLNWVPDDGSVQYLFFTDNAGDPIASRHADNPNESLSIKNAIFLSDKFKDYDLPPPILPKSSKTSDYWSDDLNLADEMEIYADIHVSPIPAGRRYFGARGIYQFQYSLKHYNFSYYMRVDDDSFPCLPSILHELQFRPRNKFLWVKYWHQKRRTRIDENFMVISRDVVTYVTSGVLQDLLPFDPLVDFGINFTFWAQTLNLTIFDDISRLDSQQSLLTTFMHHPPRLAADSLYMENITNFCTQFIYAHHVNPGMMDKTYTVTRNDISRIPPAIRPPTDRLYLVDTDFFAKGFPVCMCKSLAHNPIYDKSEEL